MFEYAAFVVRNPSYVTRNARKQWAVRKALLTHRKKYPICVATGRTTGLQVHHVVPVSVDPSMAADPLNLITLERKAHLVIGHAGNYKNYVKNVAYVCHVIDVVRTRASA